MKHVAATIILVFTVLCLETNAQTADSLSLNALAQRVDAAADLQFNSDSLKITSWADSVASRIHAKTSLDSLTNLRAIDSLKQFGQLPNQYLNRLDSINQKKQNLLAEVETRKSALLSKSEARLNKWKSAAKEKLGFSMPENMTGQDLPSDLPLNGVPNNFDPAIPDINTNIPPGLEGATLPTDGLDVANSNLPEMPQLSGTDFKTMDLSPDLSSISEKVDLDALDKLDGVSDKVGGVSDQLGSLKELQSNPDAAIESGLKNVKEFEAVQDELAGVDELKNNEVLEKAELLKDPNALKEEAKQVVVRKAVNHFAGKEQVLQAAMDKMSKYKQKYESLNSLSDIRKLPKNAMKGKPFRERFIPGVAFQILRNNDLLLDVNPYAGYRITGRLNAGAGWNQRIGYSLDHNYFTSPSVIYGPRFFTEFRTWKGFIARAEFEWMNTEVPPTLRAVLTDVHGREWVRTAFLGIKKEYRFLKTVKGTAFLMFSVYNDQRKSPYGDVLNSRFGFEFPLKKRETVEKLKG